MELFIAILLTLVSFVLIIKGGDFFVSAAVWIAKKTKMPAVLIGATVVSIGTTLPEIIVSITASVKGENGLAIGNAVGSIFCNLALIAGISMLFAPSRISKKDYLIKIMIMTVLSSLILLFILNGVLELWQSILLLCVFVVFMVFNVLDALKQQQLNALLENVPPAPSVTTADFTTIEASKEMPSATLEKGLDENAENAPADETVSEAVNEAVSEIVDETINEVVNETVNKAIDETAEVEQAREPSTVELPSPKKEKEPFMERMERYVPVMLLFFVIGAVGIALGANLLVDNISLLATKYIGIPVDIVGYTIVAFGTSLPEFVTALTSIKKKNTDISLGNVIGANIINGSLLLGICGIFGGVGGLVADDLFALMLGLILVVAISIALIATIAIKGKTYRAQGALMVASYLAYTVVLVVRVLIG